jgi:hypothetical protein
MAQKTYLFARRLFFCSVSLLIFVSAWIEDGEIKFRKSQQTLGDTRSFGCAIADVDMDGDNDIFLPNYIGPSRLWLNDGNGNFTESVQDFGNSEAHGVAVADLNGDTFSDIFLINHAAPCKVFFNDGKGVFTDSKQNIGSTEEFPGGLVLGDVDNDGDLDAFISYYELPNRLWLNDGKGFFSITNTLYGGANGNAMALADVNGDKSLDLFLCLSDQPDEIWMNDGKGNFINSGLKLGNSKGYESVNKGDIDNDGDIDFVVNNSIDGIMIWLNQKNTGKFVEAGPYFEAGTTKIKMFEADLDGDLDLITANQNTGIKLWLNDGKGNFSSLGNVFGTGRIPSICCGKLDKDNDFDIFIGRAENTGGNEIYFNDTKND